jgi:hypothetical protein
MDDKVKFSIYPADAVPIRRKTTVLVREYSVTEARAATKVTTVTISELAFAQVGMKRDTNVSSHSSTLENLFQQDLGVELEGIRQDRKDFTPRVTY